MNRCLAEWSPFIGPSAPPDALQKESVSGEHQRRGRGIAANFALIYLSRIFLSVHDAFVLFQEDFNKRLIICLRAWFYEDLELISAVWKQVY